MSDARYYLPVTLDQLQNLQLAVGERGALPFVALAGVATFCGIPVMAKWINQQLLTAFSKRLKR
ncbi:hypothetical protein [Pseudomonas sp.]|uniref:hypothetical protein n=1 Tax=Pseudomonas sp. TaxID=306 RepID=UPI003266938D